MRWLYEGDYNFHNFVQRYNYRESNYSYFFCIYLVEVDMEPN